MDLTAALAQTVGDEHVKKALDFALLEDFDHLYRYADLLDMETHVKAEDIVGRYTEIMPGRPTIALSLIHISRPINRDDARAVVPPVFKLKLLFRALSGAPAPLSRGRSGNGDRALRLRLAPAAVSLCAPPPDCSRPCDTTIINRF